MACKLTRKLLWLAFGLAILFCVSATSKSQAANLVTWESTNSLIDTTNYTGLAPYYWFANFANSSAVTSAGMDQNEARNLPNWIHLETRPACKGFADDCSTADGTLRTGYSFTETGVGGGSSSTGGQPGFNDLTLPVGTLGRSGQAVDTGSGFDTSTSMMEFRILSGAPDAFRMWVVVDNGAGANFNMESRLRVNLRDTNGPPDYTGDIDTSEAEAKPGGFRLIETGSDPRANNGIADAWSFLLSGVNENDLVIVKPTSTGFTYGAFAGIMIQPIPEPSSMVLILLGCVGYCRVAPRRRWG